MVQGPNGAGAPTTNTTLKDAPNEVNSDFEALGEDFSDAELDDDLGVEVDSGELDSVDDGPEPALQTKEGKEPKEEAKPKVEAGAQESDGTPEAEPEPAAPAPEPTTQVKQEAQPAPTPSEQPASLESDLQKISEKEADIVDQLSQTVFALDKETMDALEVDYTAGVPKLLAKTYVNAVRDASALVLRHLPQILNNHSRQSTTAQRAETEFFTRFPALNAAEHGNSIKSVAQAFRAGNPSMPNDQLMALTGELVMKMHGAAVPETKPTPQPQANPKVQAYQPAGASPPGQRPVTEQNLSPWEGLGFDLDE